jgi:integrase
MEEIEMPKVTLTPNFIKNDLICPNNMRRIEFCDTLIPGHYVEVRSTAQGQGTHYLRYKDPNGKTCHQKLGRTCDLSLKEARGEAKRLRAEIQLGANPRAETRTKKAIMSWSDFFTNRYLPHAKQHKRSWANDDEMNRLRINDRFGHLRLNQISKHQVQQFHSELREFGLAPATCDHHLKLIRQALNLAVDWELLKENPAARVKQFNEDNREERLMTDNELQRLMAALAKKPDSTAYHVIKFLLLTGARVNEALHARWMDIDRENRTWLIQATNSKSKRRRAVPLNDSALDILDSLSTEGKSEWLFTSSRGGGRLTAINKVWQRLRVDAGIPHVRLHDLRHQYASFLVNSGRTLYEVQQILGHSDPTVTQRYAHLSTRTLHEAADAASQAIRDSAA